MLYAKSRLHDLALLLLVSLLGSSLATEPSTFKHAHDGNGNDDENVTLKSEFALLFPPPHPRRRCGICQIYNVGQSFSSRILKEGI